MYKTERDLVHRLAALSIKKSVLEVCRVNRLDQGDTCLLDAMVVKIIVVYVNRCTSWLLTDTLINAKVRYFNQCTQRHIMVVNRHIS